MQKEYVEEQFITDKSSRSNIIFRDLKMLKTYNFVFNDNEVRLIRKKYSTPESLLQSKKPKPLAFAFF